MFTLGVCYIFQFRYNLLRGDSFYFSTHEVLVSPVQLGLKFRVQRFIRETRHQIVSQGFPVFWRKLQRFFS